LVFDCENEYEVKDPDLDFDLGLELELLKLLFEPNLFNIFPSLLLPQSALTTLKFGDKIPAVDAYMEFIF